MRNPGIEFSGRSVRGGIPFDLWQHSITSLNLNSARASDQGFLPIDTQKYVMLLDWTGREIRENKCGAIPENLAPILDRMGLDRSN